MSKWGLAKGAADLQLDTITWGHVVTHFLQDCNYPVLFLASGSQRHLSSAIATAFFRQLIG